MDSNLDKLNQYFTQEPELDDKSWGIVHDVNNILLHYIADKSVSDDFMDKLDKLSPDSTIRECTELFHSVGLVPVWNIWW